MVQFARPVSDVSVGGWSPAPLWERLMEEVPDEEAVSSPGPAAGDVFEVKLTGLKPPGPGDKGTSELTVRLRSSGSGDASATVVLLQGSTVIASDEVEPGSSFQDVVLPLTPDQLASISDYKDLRVRVIAGEPEVDCCPEPLPAVLQATLSSASGGCGCLEGLSFQLAWDPTGAWIGTRQGCGRLIQLSVACPNTSFVVIPAGGWGFPSGLPDPSPAQCDPFAYTWAGVQISGAACSGSVTISVTE